MCYALRSALPTYNNSNAPSIATANEVTLKPVTPTPKVRFAINPPITAPTTPKTIAPTTPPEDGWGSIAFATTPVMSPKIIQANKSIVLIVHLPSFSLQYTCIH